jgi:hypothetical protein
MPISKQLMQIAQRRYSDSRLTRLHGRTHSRIQHPLRNHPHYTWISLNVNYATAAALLDVPDLDAATIQWMPTILNFNFLPDMGRMNGNWLWGAAHGCSPTRLAARRQAPTCTRSLKRAKRIASTPIAI